MPQVRERLTPKLDRQLCAYSRRVLTRQPIFPALDPFPMRRPFRAILNSSTRSDSTPGAGGKSHPEHGNTSEQAIAWLVNDQAEPTFSSALDTTNLNISSSVVLVQLISEATAALDLDREKARAALLYARSILRVQFDRSMPPSGGRAQLAKWQIMKTVSYIRQRIKKSMSIDDLARNIQFSRSHFSRAFKATFHLTPHQFILAQRIEHAKYLMITSEERLSFIAQECRFADQAHLSRVFKKLTGQTPRSWRSYQLSGAADAHRIPDRFSAIQ
jgi:AraC family transcriptional regulator